MNKVFFNDQNDECADSLHHSHKMKLIHHYLKILFIIALCLIFADIIISCLSENSENERYWPSIRLSGVWALALGESLYSTSNNAPWVLNGYGPAYALPYFPLVLFKNQEYILFTAKFIGYLIMILPMCLFYKRIIHDHQINFYEGAAFILTSVIITLKITDFPSFHTIDPPLVAFFLISLYLATSQRKSYFIIFLSGLFLGLSVSTKFIILTALPILFHLCIIIQHQEVKISRLRSFVLFITGFSTSIILIYGYVIYLSGWEATKSQFEIMGSFGVTEPGLSWSSEGNNSNHHTIKYSTTISEKLLYSIQHFQNYIKTHFSIILLTLTASIAMLNNRKFNDQKSLKIQPFHLLLVCAFILPPCLIAWKKYGGVYNSMIPLQLVFQIAITSIIFWLTTKISSFTRLALQTTVLTILCGLISYSILRSIRYNANQAYDTITDVSINNVYFPSDPLYHILNHNLFLGSADVFHCMDYVGRPVDSDALKAHLPPEITHVAIPENMAYLGFHAIQKMLPEIHTSESPMTIKNYIVWRFR